MTYPSYEPIQQGVEAEKLFSETYEIFLTIEPFADFIKTEIFLKKKEPFQPVVMKNLNQSHVQKN